MPHAEGGKYELANGILLRADIHTLFDMRLLGIDSCLRVHLAKTLQFSEYKLYQDKRVEILPDRLSDQPRSTALEKRFALFQKEENIRTDALPKTSGR